MAQAFRGEFAAASLKQPWFARSATPATCFPRRIRRGLIEAQWASAMGRPPRSPFRGEFAAASLKHQE